MTILQTTNNPEPAASCVFHFPTTRWATNFPFSPRQEAPLGKANQQWMDLMSPFADLTRTLTAATSLNLVAISIAQVILDQIVNPQLAFIP